MITVASLFNLAGPDMIVIFFIILLLFGAKKLPELARGLGQAVREFGKAKDDFEREITHPVQPTEHPKQLDEPKVADHSEHAEPAGVASESSPAHFEGSELREPKTQRLVPATRVEGTEPHEKA
jgi:sec-independent protein translocase protein TatA